jgi:hypothetical protein
MVLFKISILLITYNYHSQIDENPKNDFSEKFPTLKLSSQDCFFEDSFFSSCLCALMLKHVRKIHLHKLRTQF